MRMSWFIAAERPPNYQITWLSCVTPNKLGHVSALLGPHRYTLARMKIFDDHIVKPTARTMRKSQIHLSPRANGRWPKLQEENNPRSQAQHQLISFPTHPLKRTWQIGH